MKSSEKQTDVKKTINQTVFFQVKKLEITLFFLCFLFVLCVSNVLKAQGLPLAAPETVGMDAARLKLIEFEVNKAISEKKLPGAVVIVGRKGKIVYRQAFGNRALVPTVEKMTVDTIFDVASLTKPVATATSIMILIEQGKIRLNDTIGKFIPEIDDKDAKNVTIQQLLTHTSGYRPDFDLGEKWTGREGMLAALKKEKLRNPAGTRFVYSDIGFLVLGEIIERISKIKLEWFPHEEIFGKLNMKSSAFLVEKNSMNSIKFSQNQIAPTENVKGQQSYLGAKFEGDEKTGNEILRGKVHDPTAFRMGGIAGHAGLFSTADDLARYCQMILNGGILDGKRIMSANTVAKMTAPYVINEQGNTRGLGFDMNSAFSANRGDLFPLGSFGHTGFTGTSIWIDPTSETFVVFLSNRVHPDGKGDVTPLRGKVSTIAASAIKDLTPEKIREAESRYYAAVSAQISRFQDFKISNLPTTDHLLPTASVLNGIDVLEKTNFKQLEGLKIGLVTNHTGKNRVGKQTIDLLFEAKNLKLVALFSPEHGIRGLLDDKVSDSTDEKTGLPIYSLYGERRRPTQEQLKNPDALVFDIQDIGTRFYTYISTLRNVMEEAAKAGKPVFVLDRTNPINGIETEGAVADDAAADDEKVSFISAHTIPVRHGLTVGEIGKMMNEERKIGADLRIIKMENWKREMWFDQTNQIWTNPSPNMRSLTQATLYGGIGLLEFTNLSVGRGTDTPFEVIGAPWIDAQKLALYLNERNLNGVRFVPIRFTPRASVFKEELCQGINIVITDRKTFKPVRTGIEIAVALRKLFPEDWKIENYTKLLVNREIYEKVKAGENPEEIEKAWQVKLNEYRNRRARFLLY